MGETVKLEMSPRTGARFKKVVLLLRDGRFFVVGCVGNHSEMLTELRKKADHLCRRNKPGTFLG